MVKIFKDLINERDYMYNNLLNNSNNYKNFLSQLEKRILEKEFENNLIEVQNIDLSHYTKKIMLQDMKNIILEYKNKEFKENNYQDFQVLLPGNPEIVFRMCLELIRYDVNMVICIEDFCLAQNIFIVEIINNVIQDTRLKNKVKIRNLQKDEEIIDISNKVDKTICIGDSNLYNRLEKEIENFIFYPYGIFEVYSDSEEFEGLKSAIYEYSIENQFELDIYDDLEFEEAINAINRDGYKFCALLLSKDDEKLEIFKNEIYSENVILNNNPFKEIKFNLEI